MYNKWVTVYTGPEPFRTLYEEYSEALKRLYNNDRVQVSDSPGNNLFFHQTFPAIVAEDSPSVAVQSAIVVVEHLLDPRIRAPNSRTEYYGHPAFDERHVPISRGIKRSVKWSDKQADERLNEDPTGNAESAADFAYRQVRREATRDLMEYHLNDHGFTFASLTDTTGGRYIVNTNPQIGFRYDAVLDRWTSQEPSQSYTISLDKIVDWNVLGD